MKKLIVILVSLVFILSGCLVKQTRDEKKETVAVSQKTAMAEPAISATAEPQRDPFTEPAELEALKSYKEQNEELQAEIAALQQKIETLEAAPEPEPEQAPKPEIMEKPSAETPVYESRYQTEQTEPQEPEEQEHAIVDHMGNTFKCLVVNSMGVW